MAKKLSFKLQIPDLDQPGVVKESRAGNKYCALRLPNYLDGSAVFYPETGEIKVSVTPKKSMDELVAERVEAALKGMGKKSWNV